MARPILPRQYQIQPKGPSLEHEMEMELAPDQQKPGKRPESGYPTPAQSADSAREKNPKQQPSAAPAGTNDQKNTWVGYKNPWVNR